MTPPYRGICCTCQSPAPLRHERILYREMFGMTAPTQVIDIVVDEHRSPGGDWCEGAGTTPQAIMQDIPQPACFSLFGYILRP